MSQTTPPNDPTAAKTAQPEIKVTRTPDYRTNYANSVQVRMSVWDFSLIFGTMHQDSAEQVDVENFQNVYISPQQAKALFNLLGHNLAQYEQTFGVIALEPKLPQSGPVN